MQFLTLLWWPQTIKLFPCCFVAIIVSLLWTIILISVFYGGLGWPPVKGSFSPQMGHGPQAENHCSKGQPLGHSRYQEAEIRRWPRMCVCAVLLKCGYVSACEQTGDLVSSRQTLGSLAFFACLSLAVQNIDDCGTFHTTDVIQTHGKRINKVHTRYKFILLILTCMLSSPDSVLKITF